MKTISELHLEILEHRESIKNCNEEIVEARTHCPHPQHFLVRTNKDEEDTSSGGVGDYVITHVEIQCKLCGHVGHGKYHKHRSEPPINSLIMSIKS